MSVRLIPIGILKSYVDGQAEVSLSAGPTVTEMLETVGIPPQLVAGVVRDEELVRIDYRPRDGETVKVLAVLGGG